MGQVTAMRGFFFDSNGGRVGFGRACMVGLVWAFGASTGWTQMFMPTSTSVGPAGDFNYSVPISVPPATSGLQPSLALSYSSGAGDGLLGMGWQLSGESRIARCPQTLLQDGVRKTVNNTISDRFCLDGQRLLAVGSGVYGANGTQYRTELDGYTKVVSYSDTSGVPKYFSVWGKNGLVAEYGNTADSKLTNNSGTTPVVWAINKSVDVMGNAMTYQYANSQSDGQHYLSSVSYGGNPQAGITTAPYVVQLTYTDRAKPIKQYSLGSVYTIAKLLSKVTVSQSGQTVPIWRYELTYESALSPATGRPRLSTVKQCLKDGSVCYPALQLSWSGQATAAYSGVAKTFPAGLDIFNGYSNLTMDLNGDGITDILAMKGTAGWALIAQPSGGFVATSKTLPGGLNLDDGVFTKTISGDFNGDGLTDVFLARGANYWILLSDGTGGFTTKGAQPLPGGISWTTAASQFPGVVNATNPVLAPYYQRYQWRVLDVDGDGIQDVVVIGPALSGVASSASYTGSIVAGDPFLVRVLKINSDQSLTLVDTDIGVAVRTFLQSPGGDLNESRYLTALGGGDFNGDGRADLSMSINFGDPRKKQAGVVILNFDESLGAYISPMSLNGSSFPLANLNVNASPYTAPTFSNAVSVDLNGDGLPDLGCTEVQQKTCPMINNGVEFVSLGLGLNVGVAFQDALYPGPSNASIGDINGDGLVDGLSFSRSPGTSVSFRINNGDGTFASPLKSADAETSSASPTGSFLTGDFDGDGMTDALVKSNTAGVYYAFLSGRETPDLLKEVSTGGVTHSVTYKTMGQAFGKEYLASTDAVSYPLVKASGDGVLAVKTQMSSDGIAKQTNEYKFGGLLASVGSRGRGSLGFRWMQVRNAETGLFSRSYFLQSYPLIGSVEMVGRGTSETDWSNLGLTTNTYKFRAFASTDANYESPTAWCTQGDSVCAGSTIKPGNRYVSTMSDVLTKAWDWNDQTGVFTALPSTATSITSQDNWGNTTQVKETTNKADGSYSGYSRTTDSVFAPADTANWRFGRVLKSSVTSTSPN